MKTKIQRVPSIEEDLLQTVWSWWNEEFPVEFAKDRQQFDQWLNGLAHRMHYVLFSGETFSAWAMTFDRDDERWFSILIPKANQGKGYGRQLVRALQQNEPRFCGWVITEKNLNNSEGRTYRSPLDFYLKLNFRQTDIQQEFTPNIHPVKIVFP